MDEILIKKIKGGMLGIKNNTKEPKEVAVLLNKLNEINKPMYEELLNDYKKTMENRKQK